MMALAVLVERAPATSQRHLLVFPVEDRRLVAPGQNCPSAEAVVMLKSLALVALAANSPAAATMALLVVVLELGQGL